MSQVRVIKATGLPLHTQAAGTGTKPLRVAAYCRVSTDSDEQENSFEAQQTHYRQMVASHPDWVPAGIFADEGISGTQAGKRPQFLAMIRSCEAGEIDLVLTKSLSRFSRNTLDCLTYVRKLKDLGISVIFEKENINTQDDASGELLLTILASISQQESASISENVRLGHVYNFQQGKGMLNPRYFLGYDRGKNPHEMVINPEQAVIVRLIYRRFLEGFSPSMIANDLNRDGVPTATGSGKWFGTTVTNILQNEKHCGDLLMQKYFTQNYLTHKVVRNRGERPQYFLENDHDPIVPKEVFIQAQGELRRRSWLKSDPNKVRFGSSNTLNGRTFCGKCGRQMRRFKRKGDGTTWVCRGHTLIAAGTARCCELTPVKESSIIRGILTAFNQLRNRYTELARMEERIFSGEIRRIDALLKSYTDEQNQLETMLDVDAALGCGDGGVQDSETSSETAAGSGHTDPNAWAVERVAEICRKKNDLYFERAEAANRDIQVRILLELVGTMIGVPSHKEDDGAACNDYEDFFSRTAYKVPDGILDADGHVVVFENSFAIRYLSRVEIFEDGLVVKFKAGIEERVSSA